MVMTNRERVGQGLEHLARGLGPFVDAHMSAAAPVGQDWLGVLEARDRSRFGSGRRYSLNDARFLLRVVTEEWRIFRDHLSRVEQSFASELRDTGNKWAHGDEFSAADTYRALDTMERLLTAADAPSQAEDVRQLRLGVRSADVGVAARASDETAPQARQPAQPQSAGKGLYWSRVTRADVLRAIEEYDRLGQDQYLAEHGFGRATTYLLIHNGRSYDSKAILGVAYGFATGVPLIPREFSGGVHGAAGVLRKLGFEIRNVQEPTGPAAAPEPGSPAATEREAPAYPLAPSARSPAWSAAGKGQDIDIGQRLSHDRSVTGKVEDAVRAAVAPGEALTTPSGRGHFCVARYTADALVLLLGENEAWTPLPWSALEGIPDFLRGRDWVRIGSAYSTGTYPGSLDEHLKRYTKTATAGWVAVVLEKAAVITIDRSRPARIRLRPGW
jgi:hypothetical protein